MDQEALPLTPTLYACHFGAGAQQQWPRLARVLASTATRHCPAWTIRVESIALPKPLARSSDGYVSNTHKLDRWCAVVAAAPEGAQVLLIDADTVILRPLDPLWEQPFDVAYTVRPALNRFPLNAGVIAVRVSDRSRAFLTAWRDENRTMLRDPAHHLRWRRRYGGINQAALGAVLESHRADGLTIARLPCVEWNCEDSTWPKFDPAVTRILHIKSQLRLAIFHGVVPGRPYLRPLVKRWRALEPGAGATG